MTPDWRKSSRSGGVNDQACVEVARLFGVTWIRDSENPRPGHRAQARTEPAVPAHTQSADLDR